MRSATWSGRRPSRGAGPAGCISDPRPRARRGRVPAPHVARRRSAAAHARGRREPASRPTTGGGRRSMGGASTRTRRRPATSTRRGCGLSSRASSASSGRRSATGSRTSTACRERCCGRSAGAALRSRRSSSGAARTGRAPRRRPPSRRGGARITTSRRARSSRSGVLVQPSLASRPADARAVRPQRANARRRRPARRIHRELAGPHGLTQSRATFARRDVLQGWCERIPAGTPVDVPLLERLADRFLASRTRSCLPSGSRPVRATRCCGGTMAGRFVRCRTSGGTRLASCCALEERVIGRALRGRGLGVGLAVPAAVERAIAARPTLSGEQERDGPPARHAMVTRWRPSSALRGRQDIRAGRSA